MEALKLKPVIGFRFCHFNDPALHTARTDEGQNQLRTYRYEVQV